MLLIGILLLGVAGVVNYYFSLQILRRMAAAGTKVGYFEIRWQVHKQLKHYAVLTRQEGGRVGVAYYGYWVTLWLMVVAVAIMLSGLAG